MQILKGKSITDKISAGIVVALADDDAAIELTHVSNIDKECVRLQEAVKQATVDLRKIYDDTVKNSVNGKKSESTNTMEAILDGHLLMIKDVGFMEAAKLRIRSNTENAEYAVSMIANDYYTLFSSMKDETMRSKADDIKDVGRIIIHTLQHKKEKNIILTEPSIIYARDLTPGKLMSSDTNFITGIVTEKGSQYSHVAIIAKSLGIPVLLKVPFLNDIDGKTAVIDGTNGTFYIEPDTATRKDLLNRKVILEQKEKELSSLIGKDNSSQSGRRIKLYANISSERELLLLGEQDAGGIGLFRTEFLFMDRSDEPSEEEQFMIYKQVAVMMSPRPVILRMMDIGGDKCPPYMKFEKEENPALGLRGIRTLLTHKDMCKKQLRAILRAAVYGDLSVMYPMISDSSEVDFIHSMVHEVMDEMQREGISFKEVKQGIMVETPAAALISDELAEKVDFFSIGTNDLTQYTLVIDRQNEVVQEFYNPYHKAIYKLIQMVVINGHNAGIPVEICGELAADTSMTDWFLQIGVDTLSVAPNHILAVRKAIRDAK